MQTRAFHIVYVVVVLVSVLFTQVPVVAQNFEQEFVVNNGQQTYRLTLSVTHALYDYYVQKSHQLIQGTFSRFVTPYSLEFVAEDLRSISLDEENFVNLALMMVHQIPYVVVAEARYPVETIVLNEGDCDCFSFLVASLLQSEGFDVVLLYYEGMSHMNVGVSLPQPPQHARTTVTYVDYGGTRYYMAECTGEDWRNGWRVGECPPDLEGAQVSVVLVDDFEQVAPGQVSSSFGSLDDSVISMHVSASFVMEGSPVIVSGRIFASDPVGNLTLYANGVGGWSEISTMRTDSDIYSFSWTPSSGGQYSVKVSWSGNAEFAGADSQVASLLVVPTILLLGGAAIFIAIVAAGVLYLMYRTGQPQEFEAYEIHDEYYETSDLCFT